MVNERGNFVGAKFMEADARNKQALSKPDAKRRVLQPGKEFGTGQEDCCRYLMVTSPSVLVEMLKICSICLSEYRSVSQKTTNAGSWKSGEAATLGGKEVGSAVWRGAAF